MKRLFGLLLVFVVFFSFGANAPRTLAAVTEQDKTALGLYSSTIDQIYDLAATAATPALGIKPRASPSDKYLEILNSAYDSSKNNTQTTRRSLEVEVLNSFIVHLNSTIPTAQNAHKSALERVLTDVTQKFQNAVSFVQKENGAITTAENQQNINNNGAVADRSNSAATNNNADKQNKPTCALWDIGTCISDLVQWFIKNTLMQIAGFFLWITSNMFSYVVQVGILNFKQWAPDALYPIWTLIRQIVSLGVVFVGLYLGFMYILGREDKFAHYIPWVIIFALFVNFSYPIARFAVDVSNVVSLNIYAAAFSNEALNNSSNAGAVIMNRLGLADLVMGATYVEGAKSAGGNIIKGINSVPAALLVVVFIFYAAYVFFMATAILAIRTAALVFLIIASPFLFIDSVLPLMGDKAQQVRKIFFEQLAVGPVFMLLIALTTEFLLVFSEGPLKAQALPGEGAGIAVFFNVFMMIIMLHITLKVTKSVAGTIGQYATDAMGKVGGFAMGAATGGAGLLARNSIGRLAMKARDSKWVTNNQNSVIGRRMYDMSNSFAKSSFDLRNSKVVAGGMNKAGMGMGAGRTTGYEEAMEARRKDILERGARIKTRYERNVTDEDGNVIHRRGDIDKEGEAAYDKYVAESGGSVFMSKEQRQLARDALGKQAEERTDKEIAEAKKNAEREVALYNAAEDTVDPRTGKLTTKAENQKNFVAELRKELRQIEETGVDLQRDTQAQSIIAALGTIEKGREREALAEDKRVQELVNRMKNMKGANPEDVERRRNDLFNDLDEKTKEMVRVAQASAGASTILGADGKPIKRVAEAPEALDLDLTSPPPIKTVADTNWDNYELPPSLRGTSTPSVNLNDVATARAMKQQEAARQIDAEMSRNTRSASAPAVDIPIDIPEVHNPATDDVAAMTAKAVTTRNEARAAAVAMADDVINKARYGSAPGDAPQIGYTPSRPPSAPSSGTSEKSRQEIASKEALTT